ncbi:hypothetical protein D3C74_208160 [compost metagenome]
MTREEILAMEPGEAMDTLILDEVLKWEKRQMWWGETRWVVDRKTNDGKDIHVDLELFSPSTDISAAWEVVEKLQESHLYIDIRTCADFYEVWITIHREGNQTETFASPKLPEAICKAALVLYWEEKMHDD